MKMKNYQNEVDNMNLEQLFFYVTIEKNKRKKLNEKIISLGKCTAITRGLVHSGDMNEKYYTRVRVANKKSIVVLTNKIKDIDNNIKIINNRINVLTKKYNIFIR